ncbi:MAG TPA: hypothetical protein VGH83_03015 [Candidatus Acidoferrum sp.]|jgi:hypothetical protein
MRSKPNSRNYLARTLAMALACCMLLFLVQIVVHDHEKGRNEGACQVCHVAHMGSAPAINAFLLDESLAANGNVLELDVQVHKDFFANGSPSRAPPAA